MNSDAKVDPKIIELTETDCESEPERGHWTGKLDFILSCLGMAVGLGNIWRFPYLCYKNGGGAFFIPYFIFLAFVGIPIFLLELSLGQYTSQGPLTCWNFAKLFEGIGLAMVFVSGLICAYYNVIISWSIWYLFASFGKTVPWASCNNTWSSGLCESKYKVISKHECNLLAQVDDAKGVCMDGRNVFAVINETLAKSSGYSKRTPSEDYLNQVGFQLQNSDGFSNLGPLRWDSSLALLLAWIIIFLCLIKGIKSSGKVVYFTALFPYLILLILFVRGLMTDGHVEGIRFYITPNITKLGEAQVWKDAAAQIFFSLSTGFGGLITLSSYNKFNTNVIRDTLIVTIGNSLTSIFAGFVIFSFLGGLAKSLNVQVSEVVDSGLGLAFIVYPQAVTFLPFPPIWAILFFLMLITLGLDSQFAMIETITTSIIDKFKISKQRKKYVLIVTCFVGFWSSLIMATPGGPYFLQLMDDYAGGWNVLLIGFLECIAISWIYGSRVFCEDIEFMLGIKACRFLKWRFFKWWWIVNWKVISPMLILFSMLFSLAQYRPSKYGHYEFPNWANFVGWLMSLFVITGILIPPAIYMYKETGSLYERFRKLTRPNIDWGPILEKNRLHRETFAYNNEVCEDNF